MSEVERNCRYCDHFNDCLEDSRYYNWRMNATTCSCFRPVWWREIREEFLLVVQGFKNAHQLFRKYRRIP